MGAKTFMTDVLLNPLKYYRYAAGATFYLSAVMNTTTTLFHEPSRNLLIQHPNAFFSGLLIKSFVNGLLFPAFYVKTLLRPRDALYLSNSMAVDKMIYIVL